MAAFGAWLTVVPAQGDVLPAAGELQVALRDGTVLTAHELTGDAEAGFAAVSSAGVRRVAAGELLAVYGVAARVPELTSARLAGGDVVYGALVGGDDGGHQIELFAPVFGRLSLPIDRVAALLQPDVLAAELSLPAGIEEALFTPTKSGYDIVAGTLHRFGAQGVSFQAAAADAPAWYGPRAFAGLLLGGAVARATPAPCTLLTRTADRLGIALRKVDAQAFTVELEDGSQRTLQRGDFACLTFGAGCVHLSDLEPKEVAEHGYDGDPVLPWRRDHCAAGGLLTAGGRTHAKGLGVHSRCRLSFEVPAGATHFWTRVAIDDSAIELPLRAHAVARVLVGDKQVFEAANLRPGDEPRDSGRIPVATGSTVTLEVDFGRGRDLGDRIDWLTPVFVVEPRRS